jgi:low affinity Fe/Cu permease
MSKPKKNSRGWFSQFAKAAACWTGTPSAFLLALLIIIVWAVTGPIFDFNDTWQLVINTGTTIVTFLMVFLIQNAQNRDSMALQIKLDELIRVTERAHKSLMDLEELEENELTKIRLKFIEAAAGARKSLRNAKTDEFDEIFSIESKKK